MALVVGSGDPTYVSWGNSVIAQQHNSTPATVALAWLIKQPGVTAPIASATNLEQLNELIEAANLDLPPSSLALLNQASDWK